MLNSVHLYREQDDVPACPNCRRTVPTGTEGSSAYTLRVRKAGENRLCVKRDCYCGQELAIEMGSAYWRYSFRCRECRQYAADLFPGRLCTHCELEHIVGVHDAATLVEGLHESDVIIPASRNDLLNGLLKGLLMGAPGLTTDEAA